MDSYGEGQCSVVWDNKGRLSEDAGNSDCRWLLLGMGLHLNFSARSPSPSLSNRNTRNAASAAALTSAKGWDPNGELVVLSQGGGRSFTSKSTLNWSKKSPQQETSRVCGLLIIFPNSLSSPYHIPQLRNESRKDSARYIELPSSRAHGKGKPYVTIRASTGNDDGDDNNRDSRDSSVPERGPQTGGLWWPYAVGSVSLASSVVAVKGIESGSAHAAVGYSFGNGQQPPSRSGGGGGGGGGGGDNGGFDPGNSGESFFGDLIYGPETEREEEIPRSVSTRRRIPDRLPAGALASLSSAAGDLMDGEGPIGGGGAGGGGRMARGVHDAHHIPKEGPYSASEVAFDGLREGPREPILARNYSQPDPFFADGDGRVQERPSTLSSPSLESSGHIFQESRGRDAAFPTMGGSTGYNVGSTHIPSGKQQPQHYQQNYGQGNEFSKGPPRGNDGYFNSRVTPSRDAPEFPQEFSSIRGKITEIPGFAQEGDKGKKSKDHHQYQGIDFSGWLRGIVNAIVGKRAGGADSGTGLPSGDDAAKRELVTEVANRTLQMIKDQTTENGLAKSSEIGALKRLQREAFSDLLKIRERLEKLEHHTGARRGKNSTDGLAGGLKTTMKGEVNAGAAYVLVDDLTTNLARYSLQHAGLLTGLDVKFTFETPVRENDVLTTQCGVGGQGSGELDSTILGGPISLQKVNYVAQINDALSLAVAPLGAKASDMAETVNHLQGQALTTFAGSGPTMYQHCRGSAIGASLRSSSVMLSMSQFLSGWGNRALDSLISGPLCLSTLAQIMVQPCDHMVFSMSAVNNLWPSPPLPSSSGFHWSELGPLVFCKTITRPTQPTGTFTFNDLLPTSSTASFLSQVRIPERDHWSPEAESGGLLGGGGTSMQSVAFSGEVDLGAHVSIGGWAQLERADWLEELEKKDFQWNLSLAKSSGPNVHWGLSMGRRKRDDWGEDGSVTPTNGALDPSSTQMQMEAFVKVNVGRGFSIQPGLVYILDKDTQTPAFMMKSSWTL
ncbi:unnamed protein product [Calypogeia fissa]